MDESLAKSSDDPQTYAIIGAAMEVHRELGHGFLEAVYHEALALEMSRCSIPYVHEPQLPIRYKGQLLNTSYPADFIAYQDVVVELKTVSQLTGVDQAQVINYRKSTGRHRALLFNFGVPKLGYKRLVW